jgi:hypothetical protein
VRRLLRALRNSVAQKLIAESVADGSGNAERPLGAVDGSGYGEPNPPAAPLPAPALDVHSADASPRPAW